MLDPAEFKREWTTRIELDLRSFGDPNCLVSMTSNGKDVTARWTMRGKEWEARFSISVDGGVAVKFGGRRLTYSAFLASDKMANLDYVAKMVLQTHRPSDFVATAAVAEDADGPESAVTLLTRMIAQPSDTATQLIMVTGDPGSGKTAVLRELVRRHAGLYLRGKTDKVLLYVNAQGRALTQLTEALATELQDLKVSLTYHSVATLARQGLLVPVIDGFDELLGLSGYDDAFSSLSAFLDELEGEGCVLASARSTYYEDEFVARAGEIFGRDSARWTQVRVRVRGWSEENRADFLRQWAAGKGLSEKKREDVARHVTEVFSESDAELAHKPLFFTKVVELVLDRPDFGGGSDLLEQLVKEYLRRELQEKLLDRHSAPMLTDGQFDTLMREIAQEMWNLETRELDKASVREVADYVAETEDISEAHRKVLVERMPSLAFLSRGEGNGGRGRVAFEHELFFFYFLSGSIVAQFESPEADVRVVLSRSALPRDVATRVATGLVQSLSERSDSGQQRLLDRLYDAGAAEWRRGMQVRENAGLLVMALFRSGSATDADGNEPLQVRQLRVRGLVFPGEDLKRLTFTECQFEDVTARRTDLTDTRFLSCHANNLFLVEPRIDPKVTRLEIRGLEVNGVSGLETPDTKTYDPAMIREVLAECGLYVPPRPLKPEPIVDPEIVGLMQRLMRAYGRANPVCLQDPRLQSLFRAPKWREIEAGLLRHSIVEKETRPTKGQKKEFLRRRLRPDQIMAGLGDGEEAEPGVRAFWRSFRGRA